MTVTPFSVLVAGLTPRVAHVTHALIVATVEHPPMPRSAGEICIFDAAWEATTVRHTGAALREAQRAGLAAFTGRYWVATNAALELRRALEERYLRDEDWERRLGPERSS